MTVTSRFPWPVVFHLERCYRLDLGVDFTIFEAEELENDESIYAEHTRDLESDVTVTSRFPWPVVFHLERCYGLDLGVDFTIFEAEELENDKSILAEHTRDLESDCDVTVTSRFPWPVVFHLIQMQQTRSWCQFHHIRGRGTRKWWNFLCITCAWPRKWMWRHDSRDLSYFVWCRCNRLDLGVDFTIFEAEELENDKSIYAELTRDLESDCDVTISVTCRISSNTDATDSILVSILPYSRLRNSKW